MKTIAQIPFPGFYESMINKGIDGAIESQVCSLMDEEFSELSESEIDNAIYRNLKFSGILDYVARQWVEYFNDYIMDECGFNPGFIFESIKSPREYNFKTDRLFCHVSIDIMHEMLDMVSPMTWANTIRKRHSSRSGFISFYSDDPADWEKPIDEYDHNELQTIIEAFLADNVNDEWEWDIFERMIYDSVFDYALNECEGRKW